MRTRDVVLATLAGLAALYGQSEIPGVGLGPPPRAAIGVETTLSRASLTGAGGAASLTVLAHRGFLPNRTSLEFDLRHSLPGATMLRIQRGAAGVPGPVVLEVPLGTAAGEFTGSVQSTDATIALFDEIAAEPQRFYAALYDGSGSNLRGQMAPVRRSIVLGLMRPENEVPAISGYNASATGAVIADVARDASGAIVSAGVRFEVIYSFPEPITFTGLHVHSGPAGMNGPVVLDSGLRNVGVWPAAGALKYAAEMDVSRADVVAALNALEYDPSRHYINMHTTTYTGGAVRSQLRPTERQVVQIGCAEPRRTDPRIADTNRIFNFIRNESGDVTAAVQTLDVQFDSYPANPQFTGLLKGIAGPRGGLYRTELLGPEHMASVNNQIRAPQFAGVDVETADGLLLECRSDYGIPQGELRISGIGTPGGASRFYAPGSILSLYGRFPGIGGTPGAYPNESWPLSLNGLEVTIGERRAPLAFVSQSQINVQAPFELAEGSYEVRFWNRNNGITRPGPFSSPPVPITILPDAPVILTGEGGAQIYKANGTRVTPDNAAGAGDVLTIYATGLGRTNPASQTGRPAGPDSATAAEFAVGFGNMGAVARSAAAVPGLIGVYAVTAVVPPGIPAGMNPVRITGQRVQSQPVNTWFR